MLYPYENYLKSLIIKGLGNQRIIERLKALKLTPPSDDEIEDKRVDIFDSIPDKYLIYISPGIKYDFKVFMAKAKKSLKFLDIDEILPVLGGKRDLDWEDALLLMTDNELQALVSVALIDEQSDEEILNLLERRHRARISDKGLNLFKKYFWNIDKLSKLEKYHYISTVEHYKVRGLLLDAFHKKDARVKWKLTGENILTLEDILSEVMNESFHKFKAAIASEEVDNVQKVAKWADLAIKAAEKYKNVTNKQSGDAIASLQFKLKKISQADIQDPDDLEGGVE